MSLFGLSRPTERFFTLRAQRKKYFDSLPGRPRVSAKRVRERCFLRLEKVELPFRDLYLAYKGEIREVSPSAADI